MQITSPLKPSTRILLIFVIIVHGMFFILEALCWTHPLVNGLLVPLLNNPLKLPVEIQAITLRNLFINQGFYNLFLVVAGVYGLALTRQNHLSAGYALILFLCFAATGAGLVLAFSTRAWLLAFFQAVPAAWVFFQVYPKFRTVLKPVAQIHQTQ